MIKRVLTLVNAMHITASVFINDDKSGLHHDYKVWLEKLAPHAPIEALLLALHADFVEQALAHPALARGLQDRAPRPLRLSAG